MVILGYRNPNEVFIFRTELQLLKSGSSEMNCFKVVFDALILRNIS